MWCPAIVLALFTLCLHQGEALKCYTCSSATEEKCKDPMDTSLSQTECTPQIVKDAGKLYENAVESVSGFLGKLGVDSPFEVKDPTSSTFVCLKAVRQDGDKKAVIRSCGIAPTDKFDACKTMKNAEGGKSITFCDTCEKDGCNGATTAVPTSVFLLLLAAIAAYLVKQ